MRAKRSLGQNFLVDRHYQQKIVAALGARSGETIIEIGPGRGALTQWLVETGANVVAIETDTDLLPILEESFGSRQNFRVIAADALAFDYSTVASRENRARLIGNLPYNISTPLLSRLIEYRDLISELVVMLQREVVDRMVATPGGKEYGYLSVMVQLYSRVERLFDVPPGAFRPAPKVHSTVCRARLSAGPSIALADERWFRDTAQVIFAQRRKTLRNNLRAGRARLGVSEMADLESALAECEIDPGRRAETLSIAEIARLSDCISKKRL
ncbi:MAG TPA: 16S rRNA (adenine(1518)-N(6)/adenine(1519)-N(6))-dimethyltransferase RsmA [Pyrinomonadaceae bacterium]|nr:16S rRNA (adenine(1518)-N(6)/adenine(1519)-N(6))-dimethyltransferase RsmA [Pyrinomonadaceae bacterium]